RTGIITRNCRKAVRTVFPDIASYCRVVITREDVHKAKPHPEQIQLALDRLGAAAEFSVMVGDHPLDIETGRRGGTLTAGVLTGYFQEADFARAHANVVLTQAADLLAYLAPSPFPD
ncbi:MAG TPA: HAD-IA family hydrolase, partial [Smithellaceae bacterium]|nr:HAD-IA family hydrolase [Smithellaceae bacterium]